MSSPLMDELWRRMTRIYGQRWASNFGPADDGTWAAALADVTAEQVGRGLDACIQSGDEWPPTLPQFRVLCLGGMDAPATSLTDAELVRACRASGIETMGRSRKQLEAKLGAWAERNGQQRRLQ